MRIIIIIIIVIVIIVIIIIINVINVMVVVIVIVITTIIISRYVLTHRSIMANVVSPPPLAGAAAVAWLYTAPALPPAAASACPRKQAITA